MNKTVIAVFFLFRNAKEDPVYAPQFISRMFHSMQIVFKKRFKKTND